MKRKLRIGGSGLVLVVAMKRFKLTSFKTPKHRIRMYRDAFGSKNKVVCELYYVTNK